MIFGCEIGGSIGIILGVCFNVAKATTKLTKWLGLQEAIFLLARFANGVFRPKKDGFCGCLRTIVPPPTRVVLHESARKLELLATVVLCPSLLDAFFLQTPAPHATR